jgi:hypothetical protein
VRRNLCRARLFDRKTKSVRHRAKVQLVDRKAGHNRPHRIEHGCGFARVDGGVN